MTSIEPTVSQSVDIAATPAAVYELITDLGVLAELAEEAVAMRWLGAATGARPGAVFVGANRNGVRRWSTRCTVTDAVPARQFAFEVIAPVPLTAGFAVSRWQYDLTPAPGGCTVTESTWDRRSPAFARFAGAITGVSDRTGASRAHIAATLQRLKARAESD